MRMFYCFLACVAMLLFASPSWAFHHAGGHIHHGLASHTRVNVRVGGHVGGHARAFHTGVGGRVIFVDRGFSGVHGYGYGASACHSGAGVSASYGASACHSGVPLGYGVPVGVPGTCGSRVGGADVRVRVRVP